MLGCKMPAILGFEVHDFIAGTGEGGKRGLHGVQTGQASEFSVSGAEQFPAHFQRGLLDGIDAV